MRPSRRTRKRKSSSRPPRPKDYLAERTYKRIREKIYTGGFRPGEHLKEEILVKEFGASRSVIRQALTSLTAEGLLVDRPKIGKFVAEFTEELIAKLVPIRIVLEQLAVKEAIANLTEDDARELRAIADNLQKPQESLADQDALDVALHRKIWSLTGNDELEKLLIRVVGPFHIVSNGTLASPYYRRNAAVISVQQVLLEREKHAAGHQPIVDALCRKDAEAATKAMAAHIAANYETPDEDFSKSVSRFLKKYLHSL
jgi:DNA-binding GntR family transcriptional regulator